MEAELAFIDFNDLMHHIETIVRTSALLAYIIPTDRSFLCPPQICETVATLLADPASAALIKQLNPAFAPPARPFLRMSYEDAIAWLRAHNIQRPAEDAEGKPLLDASGQVRMVDHEVGDDIAEAAERQMTDVIGRPMFLHGFPAALKAFYMKKIPAEEGRPTFTESCDLLMPNVGEIVGALRCVCLWCGADG
jgi:asparaginyl-tRNA synthetase